MRQTPWYLGWTFLSILLIGPIVFFSKDVWMLNPVAPFLPLNSQIFEDLAQFFGGYRLVLPEEVVTPSLFVLTYIPLLLLGVVFFVVRKMDFGKNLHPNLIAFCTACILTTLARPGLSAAPLWDVLLHLIFLIPLIQNVPNLWIWLIGNLGILAAFVRDDLRPVLFWAAVSILFASALNFTLVERTRINRNHKKNLLSFSAQSLGLLIFALWILIQTLSQPFTETLVGTSPHYWLAFGGGAFAVLLSYLVPWETKRWMAIATFFQGMLIFKTLLLPSLILLVYLGLRLIGVVLAATLNPKSKMAIPSIRWSLIILGILFMNIRLTKVEAPRTLPEEWVDILGHLDEDSYFVYGQGWPLLAQFRDSNFFSDESWILEKSEDVWKRRLEAINATQVIIHVESLKSLWTAWIAAGKKPEQINQSMLSRLIVYKGEAVRSPTLKLNAVKGFKIEPLTEKSEIVLIKLNAS